MSFSRCKENDKKPYEMSPNPSAVISPPFHNAGQAPDIAALAKEAGVDEESAKEVLDQMVSRIGVLRNKKANK